MFNLKLIKEPSKKFDEDEYEDIEYNYLFKLCKVNKFLFNYINNFNFFKELSEVSLDELNIYSGYVEKNRKCLYSVNDNILKKNDVNKLLMLSLIKLQPIFKNNFKDINEFLDSENYYLHNLVKKRFDIFYPYNEYYEYYHFFNIKNNIYIISYINLNDISISIKNIKQNFHRNIFDVADRNKNDNKYYFYKSLCEKINVFPYEQ